MHVQSVSQHEHAHALGGKGLPVGKSKGSPLKESTSMELDSISNNKAKRRIPVVSESDSHLDELGWRCGEKRTKNQGISRCY